MELLKISSLLLVLHAIQSLHIAFVYSEDSSSRILNRTKRITDKDVEAAKSVSYLVRLDQADELGKHFLCSGTLVHPNFVLTASHCVMKLPLSSITVRGDLPFVKPHRIIKISTPQDYGKIFKDYDIAILKIDPPFQTDSVYLQPIELCDSHIKEGEQLQISGYHRHLANTTFISWRQCSKFYDGIVDITRNMFCGAPQAYSNTCSRDAGGPVVLNGKLCGIVLCSAGWIDSSFPDIYMSTKSVKRFIEYTLASK